MNQIISLSKKLISTPSVSGNIPEIGKVIKIVKKELDGFKSTQFLNNEHSSLLYSNHPSKKQKIILNGHLDVVPAKKEQFKPLIKNNRLYGRGAYDMKVAAAVMIILYKELAGKVSYPLGLQLVTDEEMGGFNGTKLQIEKGINADFVIAGENTNLKINNVSKGIIWLKLKTQGKTAHGAYPWFGENAIWKMHKALNAIEKLYPELSKEQWVSTINLANIETKNRTFNKVPDECVASLDIRFIPGDDKTIVDKIRKAVFDLASVEIVMQEPSHNLGGEDVFINKLKDSIKSVTGKSGEMVSLHGASDMRFYTSKGIPAITFGPAGGGQHSDNEWVYLKSLKEYYLILKRFLESA